MTARLGALLLLTALVIFAAAKVLSPLLAVSQAAL